MAPGVVTLILLPVTRPCSTCVAALAERTLDSESIMVRLDTSRCFCWSVTNSQTDLAAGQQLEQRQATLYENASEMHVPPGTVRTASPSDGRWSATCRLATRSGRPCAAAVASTEKMELLPAHCYAAFACDLMNVSSFRIYETFPID